ncbi:IS1182 family transposase [Alkalihalobacillus hwajinpoensis]|uniref:IS1182 family transposase n=1 Tax=Guptibacillus hwajinpoensis TaxID=208199 RepID=UPI00188474D8|nr:IS1182 family transposase [Pseudalkalibacillus hwajinpoensis]MBF0705016.1 IS1182 family transposase [Pseudalkalibacillus hwajinpoensis]MBF0707292.1 IS1182 family transposase [Pseudalkalibacillus hwajinpoensis]
MFKDYNMNQVILPLDLEMKLQENDIAYAVHELVEQIPDEAFSAFLRDTGCPAYHPRMMMKVILCAYTQSAFSGRKIEGLLKDSVRMMWLAQGYEPSYRTINRFRVHPEVKELLRQGFVQFRCQLVQKDLIDDEAIFIDGTKIEANANKFTFVWRKAIERYSESLIEKSNAMYDELIKKEVIPEIERESPEQLSIKELSKIEEKLEEKVGEYNEKIETSADVTERKQLRSERKGPKQFLKQMKDFVLRKTKYENDMAIFKERNSYSKTDHDATFMRMKEDYMKNGQLKAGYNLQIATEGQYTLAYDIFPNPTDTRTFLPFLDRVEKDFFQLPTYVVADAGYGSEENYIDVLENRKRTPLITYNTYRKEKKKSYRKDAFHVSNWDYNEKEDTFTCPNGKQLPFRYVSHRTDRGGFTREFKVYESENCTGCPFRSHCTKAKDGTNRKIFYNAKWEEQKNMIQQLLSDEKTGEIYGQRKIDVEPVFGFLKAILGFTRMSVRGKEKVKNEMGFALMAVNLRKYTAMNAE